MNNFVNCNHVLSFKVNGGRSAVLTQGYYLSEKSLGKQTSFKDTENCKRIFFLGCHKFSRTLKKEFTRKNNLSLAVTDFF